MTECFRNSPYNLCDLLSNDVSIRRGLEDGHMLESVFQVILRLLVDAFGDSKVYGYGITLTFCSASAFRVRGSQLASARLATFFC